MIEIDVAEAIRSRYDYSKIMAAYQESLDERSDYESEWRKVSTYLMPGRGIYNRLSTPRKRRLTNPAVVNPMAEDALYVLASGMHGGLTSPSRPWFSLNWSDPNVQQIEFLKWWIQDCSKRLHSALQASNFYSVINGFYLEYSGFGIGSVYVGEDSDIPTAPFRFELLTAGEYSFSVSTDGLADRFFRVVFMSPRQVVEKFGMAAPESMIEQVANNRAGADVIDQTIMETVIRQRFSEEMPYSRIYYLVTSPGHGEVFDNTLDTQCPLGCDGFFEFPYPTARWSAIGQEIYSLGPGSRAIPDIRRIQEVEKSMLMAAHKTLNPPTNAPAKMRGKLNLYPGGDNYYSNPQEVVTPVYNVNFDFQGTGIVVQRAEDRIRRNFFNDIFLTASRDPNASPLKATQVQVQEQEKMLRLGPVIEKLQHEFLRPIVERCFNIMLRKDMFAFIPPEYAEFVSDYEIHVISPLAVAQRSVALNSINSFLAFIGNAANISREVLDKIDPDAAVDEYADITGVDRNIIRPQQEVDKIRKQRAEMLAQEQAKQDQLLQIQLNSQLQKEQSETAVNQAKAQDLSLDAQATATQIGLV